MTMGLKMKRANKDHGRIFLGNPNLAARKKTGKKTRVLINKDVNWKTGNEDPA